MGMEDTIIEFISSIAQKPVDKKDIILSVCKNNNSEELSEEIDRSLAEMVASGKLVLNRKGKYGTLEQFSMVVGTLRKNPKGFGFLEQAEKDVSDIYIAGKDMAGAMNGDLLIVHKKREAIFDKDGQQLSRAEGKVVNILQRKIHHVVGRLELGKNFGFVVPDDKKFGGDIFISKKNLNGARHGMKVLVEISVWPDGNKKAEGAIVQVFGNANAPGVDMMGIIYEYDLPQQFPVNVLEQAAKIPAEIPQTEIERRRDLRKVRMVTIDGDDAKDLDDAVSLEVMPDGDFLLGVHIADVGHYVQEGSALDQEALSRATSVYLADRVIPMLPQKLSNELCSLNEQEDRLAMTCFMLIGKNGEIKKHEVCESVICVNRRMTYRNVNKMLLDNDLAVCEKYKDVLPMLKNMARLQPILEEKRKNRGAITFNLPESKVILDKKGKVVRIEQRESKIAEKMIEEFMLAANETVSEQFFWLDVPFLYRIHEEPNSDDVATLNQYLQSIGYSIKGGKNGVHPREYQQIIDATEHTEVEMIVNKMLLRSMQHARYATEPLGHFGLATKYYSHFTSPIRRYPDLAIHRVIKELLKTKNALLENRRATLIKNMEHYALQSSAMEKRAEEAERDSIDLKKAEYMKAFVGETFKARISGITNFGIFVQLDNSVEGLIHISTLDEYYIYDAEKLLLIGELSGKKYQIGQEVDVKLVRVGIEEKQIDFEMVKKSESYNGKQKSKTRF